MSRRHPVHEVRLTIARGEFGEILTARKCVACGCRVFLHRRGKPFTCKTCGAKQPRRLS